MKGEEETLNSVSPWVLYKVKIFEFLERKLYWIHEPNRDESCSLSNQTRIILQECDHIILTSYMIHLKLHIDTCRLPILPKDLKITLLIIKN